MLRSIAIHLVRRRRSGEGVPVHHLLRLATLLLLSGLLPAPEALARSAQRINRLVDQGRVQDAQARCTRMEVWTETDRAIRDACARAYWSYYERQDTAQGWRDFQQLFGDTYLAEEAARREVDTAIRHARSPSEALEVARTYPDHPDLVRLFERHLGAFVQLREEDGELVATLEPEIPLPPGARLETSPAARLRDGEIVAWDDAVARHLEQLGFSSHFVDRARQRGEATDFPVCPVPGAGITPGVRVAVGSAETFIARTEPEACPAAARPVIFTMQGERIASLSFGPDQVLVLATDDDLEWGTGTSRTRIPVPAEAGDPIVVGPVVGQQAGSVYLLHPVAGGMPWYVAAAPPPRALALPSGLRSVDLPDGWTLSTARGPVHVGEQARQPVQVEGPGLRGTWTLPPGRIGVLSPIAAQVTGLHAANPALRRERGQALPSDPHTIGPDGPRGGDGVFHEEVSAEELGAIAAQLDRLGFADLRVDRAWRVRLTDDDSTDLVFSGRLAGQPIKGLVDPMTDGGGDRVFLWHPDARGREREVPFAFRWNGRTYFAWRGPNHVEAVHAEEIGIVREVVGPEPRAVGQVEATPPDEVTAP